MTLWTAMFERENVLFSTLNTFLASKTKLPLKFDGSQITEVVMSLEMLVFPRDGARGEMLGRGEMPPTVGSGRGEKILTNNALQIGLNCEHIL